MINIFKDLWRWHRSVASIQTFMLTSHDALLSWLIKNHINLLLALNRSVFTLMCWNKNSLSCLPQISKTLWCRPWPAMSVTHNPSGQWSGSRRSSECSDCTHSDFWSVSLITLVSDFSSSVIRSNWGRLTDTIDFQLVSGETSQTPLIEVLNRGLSTLFW